MTNSLSAAVAFLTRLPVARATSAPDPAGTPTGAVAFGVVGACVGLVGAAVVVALGDRAPLAAAAAALGAMAIAAGGLHLDGLADTFDALAAPNAAAAERARKDPAIGAAGAVALTLSLLIGVGLISALIDRDGAVVAALGCVVAGAASRTVPVVGAAFARRGRETGAGSWFVAGTDRLAAGVATASALLIGVGATLVTGRWSFAVGEVAGIVATLVVAAGLIKARGGVDGDTFGALIEIGFVAVLLGIVAAS